MVGRLWSRLAAPHPHVALPLGDLPLVLRRAPVAASVAVAIVDVVVVRVPPVPLAMPPLVLRSQLQDAVDALLPDALLPAARGRRRRRWRRGRLRLRGLALGPVRPPPLPAPAPGPRRPLRLPPAVHVARRLLRSAVLKRLAVTAEPATRVSVIRVQPPASRHAETTSVRQLRFWIFQFIFTSVIFLLFIFYFSNFITSVIFLLQLLFSSVMFLFFIFVASVIFQYT